MEKRNSQLEQGLPMEQTGGLICTCHSRVACCQSQDQCHFWQMKSVFLSVLHRQVHLAVVNQICVIHEAMNGCKNLKIH